jgi:long-chain fatty acid transport protein
MIFSTRQLLAALLIVSGSQVYATNGMNMEGYGPIATAMGGAGMAYDNGTAALMNNPATLALMADGTRVDLAAGFLGPNVKANGQGSSATAFVMPAFGIAHKQNDLVFGFGIFAQGGMGTEYSNSSFYSRLMSTTGTGVTDPGLTNRSEIGVGRALIPLAWKVNDQLTLGASLDYVWATMDLKMLIDGARFGDMIGGSQRFGQVGGSLTGLMAGFTQVNWGYFDFSDNNAFSGAAKGTGWAGKLGATYKVSPELTAGLVYQSKTALSDLTASSATVSFNGVSGGNTVTMPIQGKVKVVNFQWPDMYGFGLSYTPNDRWQLVADYRRIGWSAVMKQFKMSFESSMGNLDMTMNQNWKDQDVLMLGASYKYTSQLTLRGGVNVANNPVPAEVTNPLFPAIVKSHLTGGLGYAFDPKSSLDFSMTYAPKVKVNSAFSGAEVSHGQINGQIMYSMFF